MIGADLTDAGTVEAILIGADMRGAILTGTKLHRASMMDVDLREADLTGADLTNVDLTGARLEGVVGVPRFNRSTEWPRGFHPRRFKPAPDPDFRPKIQFKPVDPGNVIGCGTTCFQATGVRTDEHSVLNPPEGSRCRTRAWSGTWKKVGRTKVTLPDTYICKPRDAR